MLFVHICNVESFNLSDAPRLFDLADVVYQVTSGNHNLRTKYVVVHVFSLRVVVVAFHETKLNSSRPIRGDFVKVIFFLF